MSTDFDKIAAGRRLIGPIPPRDKRGRLMITPILRKEPKRNILGEPERDDKGRPIEIDADARNPLDYMLYERGSELHVRKGATDGLAQYDVILQHQDPQVRDPIYRVWARDEADAERVFKVESGATRWTESEIKIRRVK